MNQTVAFLGAGNMAGAIIGGLIESGMAADNITATSPDSAAQDAVREKYGIHSHADNQKAAESADILVLAVKPQILKAVCEPLKGAIQARESAPRAPACRAPARARPRPRAAPLRRRTTAA